MPRRDEHRQARFEFLQREGFDHVVVGAGIEAGELLVERIARGQHQHGRLAARFLTQLFAKLQTVHAGQCQIEHDRVEVVDDGEMQSGYAVSGEIDDMSFVFEIIADVGGDIAVVFNDKNSHRRRILADRSFR